MPTRKPKRGQRGTIKKGARSNAYEKSVRRIFRDLITGRAEQKVSRQYNAALRRYQQTQAKAARIAAQLDKQRKQLVKLGLLTKKVDLKRAPTRYQKGVVRKYVDVLTGRAKVIQTRSPIQAAKFKESYPVKGRNIIVPRAPGERVTFSRYTGELRSTRKVGGKTVTRTIAAGKLAPLGPGEYYVMPFANGTRFRTNDLETLMAFMTDYEKREKNPFKDWRKYVEVETIENASEDTVALTSHPKARSIIKRGKKKLGR